MRPGDDDRATVDLGPRPAMVDGGGGERPPTDPGDLGPDDAAATQADHAHGTQDPAAIDPTESLTSAPDVHALPTQQLARGGKGSSDSHATKYSATATSPAEAMRLEEIARTQIFLKVAIITCFAGVGVALATGGNPIAFRVVMAGCIVTMIGALWMFTKVRDPATFSHRAVIVPALVIAFGAFGGVYYWGAASPVAAMITYGIYFFSLGSNARITTAMYVLVSVLHGTLLLLIASGVVIDRGIVNIGGLKTIDQVGVLAVIEFLYFITFYTARTSQRVTLEHVSKLEQAVRGVAQREALLAEARAELDRALKVGGPGRFTDQTVGSFKLGLLIGRGGMGEVYEATGAQGEAAVKLLHAGTLSDPTHVARFVREAQTAAKLDTPHVVRVLEVGTTQGEVPYLAMERLRGHDLAHQLRKQRRIALADARTLALHISQGLEAAREAGIVHRDLTPHNVFLGQDGRWKILDFGVSKSGGTGTLTKGHVIGTPAYMAPEQARGENVDHRADVYSLAAILYRSVTGHPAFTGKDVPTTLYDVVYRVPTQPSLLIQLPADIDRVLAIGLAKDARDRFDNAVELADWFAAAVTEELTPEQRRRADDLLARHPWGTRQT
ncbi:MAG TPA: serine/threonine-protein kinase [Kofleriaceae bacterium]|nr:serine/threonine-protein kinase [Kofleriaceae bacterium]